MRFVHATLLSVLMLLSASLCPGGEQPPNKWVLMGKTGRPGPAWSGMVYVPERKTLLQWGAKMADGPMKINDMRVLDMTARKWISDAPTTTQAKWPAAYSCGGSGFMIKGTPAGSCVVYALAYDTRRKRIFYPMGKLMAAYDPQTKKWEKVKAQTQLWNKRWPGGPPVSGAGMEYDPVNDELVMFPHWGAQNYDEWSKDHQVFFMSGHLGTLIFSFKDNVWRRHRAGTKSFIALRSRLLRLSDTVTTVVEKARRAESERELGRAARAKEFVAQSLKACATAASELKAVADQARQLAAKATGQEKAVLGLAVKGLQKAAADMATTRSNLGRTYQARYAAAGVVQDLANLWHYHVRLEPPVRCTTPMIYVPQLKSIAVFGGYGGHGSFNDLWLYDCATRTWAQRQPKGPLPPPQQYVRAALHTPSGRLILLTMKDGLWSYDFKANAWHKHNNVKLPIPTSTSVGSAHLGYHQAADLLVVEYDRRFKGNQQTWLLKFAPGKTIAAKGHPAATYEARRPADPRPNPALLAKLKTMPANAWTKVPGKGAIRREWGNLGYDPLLQRTVHFGGGHSSYQVNRPSMYFPETDLWLTHYGETNRKAPDTGWGGTCQALMGGTRTSHKRNKYEAVDGKMYDTDLRMHTYLCAPENLLPRLKSNLAWTRTPNYFSILDLDTWQWRVATSSNYKAGAMLPYRDTVCLFSDPKEFRIYDRKTGDWKKQTVPPPHPGAGKKGESRRFSVLHARDAFFFYGYGPKGTEAWLYDLGKNKWQKLPAARKPSPNAHIGTLQYVPGEDLVFLYLKKLKEVWFYSFKKKTWAKLPTTGTLGNSGPYQQTVYDTRYKIFISTDRGTSILRPDFSKLKWK
jgi:Galactose oxidase, central domain